MGGKYRIIILANFMRRLAAYFNEFIAAAQEFAQGSIWLTILVGIGMPLAEALFPILPILAIVTANVTLLGPFWGVLLSVIGSAGGMYLVFLVLNLSIGKRFRKSIITKPQVLRFNRWLSNKSTGFYVFILSVPFIPSAIVNYAMSLTSIGKKRYGVILFASRGIMFSVIGFLSSLMKDKPFEATMLILGMYFVGYGIYYGIIKLIKYIKNRRRLFMSKKTVRDLNLKGKVVLMRVDFNVPLKCGVITDDNRIVQALPTIKYVKENGGKLVLFSHLGRVKTEEDKKDSSLAPVVNRLSELLGEKVVFVSETRGKKLEAAIKKLKEGEVLMFENTRFEDLDGNKESKNNPELGAYWASLGDVFVNDAFGTAHRAHASNVGVAANIKGGAVAGFLLEKEIKFIGDAVNVPERPFVAILGGAKVSDKISVIENLINKADKILICGAMAYTFFKALGYEVGKSKVEDDYVKYAEELLKKAKGKIILPVDHLVASEFSADAEAELVDVKHTPADKMGLDIGPKTLEVFKKELHGVKTVVWNGPAGVFEFEKFAAGTKGICEILANLEGAKTIIGGGDSAAAAISMGYESKFRHISTGGGASLEYLEGKDLPGITCLNDSEKPKEKKKCAKK
jgi:phosphoglycerate kinase